MGGRHGPHPITSTDELLELVIDELRGLRADLARNSAPAGPEPSASEATVQPDREPVAIEIREPATKPAARPVKVAEPAAVKPPTKRAPRKES